MLNGCHHAPSLEIRICATARRGLDARHHRDPVLEHCHAAWTGVARGQCSQHRGVTSVGDQRRQFPVGDGYCYHESISVHPQAGETSQPGRLETNPSPARSSHSLPHTAGVVACDCLWLSIFTLLCLQSY